MLTCSIYAVTKSSISRHNARRHNNSKDAPVIKSFYDKDEIVARARDWLLKLEKEEEKKKNKGGGKQDTLLVELKALKLKDQTSTKKNDPSFPSPLAAVDSKCHKEVADLMLKWPHAKNLIDLTNICQQLRFFGGDAEKGVLAVLRCETCYNFLLSKRTASLTTNPVAVAKKGLCG